MQIETIEWLWVGVGLVFLVFSLIGLFNKRIPVIPFSYLAVLILQLMYDPPFSVELLIILFFIGILIMWIDYQVYQFMEKYVFLFYVIKGMRIGFFLLMVGLFVYGLLQ